MSEQNMMHWAPQPGYDEASVMCDPHLSVFKHTDKIREVTCQACLSIAITLGRDAENRMVQLGMIDVAAENLAHPADLAQPSAGPGSPAHVEMWDAISEFCRASGGRTDATNIGRQVAVARVERAVEARARELAAPPTVPAPLAEPARPAWLLDQLQHRIGQRRLSPGPVTVSLETTVAMEIMDEQFARLRRALLEAAADADDYGQGADSSIGAGHLRMISKALRGGG